MSAITVQNYIDCDNKELDCCTLFKGLLVVDSLGDTYIRGMYGLGGNNEGTFDDADQEDLVIDGDSWRGYRVTHNWGRSSGIGCIVNDNNDAYVTCELYAIDADTSFIITDQAITGTWSYKLFY